MSLSTSVSIERQKRQILKTLNIDSRPQRLRQTPQIPYSLRSSITKEHDFNDGVLETMLVEPRSQSWSCVTPEAIISDCFEYSLKSVNHQIISASFSISSPSTNFSVIIYEVDDLFGEIRYVDRFEVKEVLENQRLDMSKMFQEWMRTRYQVKMIKIEILNPNLDVLEIHDYLNSPPHFEITVFKPNTVTPKNCDGCCLLPFYTNFTEIGWSDWILSPPGFWSNHCAGSCDKYSDETWEFLRSLKIPNIPEPGCAPNYFGSVDMVVALSARDIRKTRVHGLRALSCSCA